MESRQFKIKQMSATGMIALSFFAAILLGGCLLALPAFTNSGTSVGFLNGIFLATSATCVTGLATVDVASTWNLGGQLIILLLIQIGGLGLMTFVSLASYILSNKISVKFRQLVSAAANADGKANLKRILRYAITGTLVCELLGAGLLAIRFVPQFGAGQGIWKSLFLSVSAFCNAGLDLFGQDGQFYSLSGFANDPLVILVLSGLIMIGGLGFLVWLDVLTVHKWSLLKVHTKVVLVTTGLLLAGGFVSLLLLEWNNPETLAGESVPNKLLQSFFQAVVPRTAGFSSMNLPAMEEGSQMVMMSLMFVGGAPGSTAGGVKVTALAVLVLSLIATIKGQTEVNVFQRRLENTMVQKVAAVVTLYFFLIFLGTILLSVWDGIAFLPAMFEVVSAITTTGLSFGITPALSAASKILLMLLMYFGRVGIISFVVMLLGRDWKSGRGIRYPEGKLFI